MVKIVIQQNSRTKKTTYETFFLKISALSIYIYFMHV